MVRDTHNRTRDLVDRLLSLTRVQCQEFVNRLPNRETVDAGEFLSAAYQGYLRATATYDPERGTAIETWLYQCVNSALMDERRRQSVEASRRADLVIVRENEGRRTNRCWDEERPGEYRIVPEADVDVAEEAIDLLSRREIRAAVALLPIAQQVVITEYYFRGRTMQTIADSLQISRPKLYRLRHTALVRLRRLLEKSPPRTSPDR